MTHLKAEREEVISALVNDFREAFDGVEGIESVVESRKSEIESFSNKRLEIEWLVCFHEKIIVI